VINQLKHANTELENNKEINEKNLKDLNNKVNRSLDVAVCLSSQSFILSSILTKNFTNDTGIGFNLNTIFNELLTEFFYLFIRVSNTWGSAKMSIRVRELQRALEHLAIQVDLFQ
jgi:hypothetical protein